MGEVPYTREHGSDRAERELAEAVRRQIPVPSADGAVLIRTAEREIRVDVERRRTESAIAVGMMLRRRFDGEQRGMLFEYPHAQTHAFWMKNCPIPIDLAYIGRGRIEQICTMDPGFGLPQQDLRRYESAATADLVLEMPANWFAANGVRVGDTVAFLP
jgi:uncharacterized membrane protein (UPF0127 family)